MMFMAIMCNNNFLFLYYRTPSFKVNAAYTEDGEIGNVF